MRLNRDFLRALTCCAAFVVAHASHAQSFFLLDDDGGILRLDPDGSSERVASLEWTRGVRNLWIGLTEHPNGKYYAMNMGGDVYELDTITSPPRYLAGVPYMPFRFSFGITSTVHGNLVINGGDLYGDTWIMKMSVDRQMVVSHIEFDDYIIWTDIEFISGGVFAGTAFNDGCLEIIGMNDQTHRCELDVSALGELRGVERIDNTLHLYLSQHSNVNTRIYRFDAETLAPLGFTAYELPPVGAGVSICPAPPSTVSLCRADIAAPLGVINVDDVLIFLQAFSVQNPAADINRDSTYNIEDVLLMVNAFTDGGC